MARKFAATARYKGGHAVQKDAGVARLPAIYPEQMCDKRLHHNMQMVVWDCLLQSRDLSRTNVAVVPKLPRSNKAAFWRRRGLRRRAPAELFFCRVQHGRNMVRICHCQRAWLCCYLAPSLRIIK